MGKKKKGNSGYKASATSGVKVVTLPPCHIGFTSVHSNVFVGKATDVLDVIDKVDILVPLDNVDGMIWDYDWKGDIYYVPIKDFSVLPLEVEKQKVQYVLDRIAEGKKVAIFCIGGHGRTGYFASMVLGKLGIEDPIKVLRETYCKNSVETSTQIKAIADYLGKPKLISDYPCYKGYDESWLDYYLYGTTRTPSTTQTIDVVNICGKCSDYRSMYGDIEWGYCTWHNKTVNCYDQNCR